MLKSEQLAQLQKYEQLKQKIEMLRRQREESRERNFGAAADRLIAKGVFDASQRTQVVGLAKRCADDPEIKRMASRYNELASQMGHSGPRKRS